MIAADKYRGKDSFFGDQSPLSQRQIIEALDSLRVLKFYFLISDGFIIIIGVGMFLSALATALSWLDITYGSSNLVSYIFFSSFLTLEVGFVRTF